MPNDISRRRFDALNDYGSVAHKQGAVVLDADLNEGADIADRRLRALASDVMGRATVSQTTPQAFKIVRSGSSFTIGKGRLYVDGLLAENHGAPAPGAAELDPLLAEAVFSEPVEYSAQPYLPEPPQLPPVDGRFLIYLDVWRRELTHIEQSNLIEVAVGVESSARVQTVWQVRALGLDRDSRVSCSTRDEEIPGWSELIAPSTGVLSTGTTEIDPVTDPCELPPTGGYRGLENQTYRVEIHDPGHPGGATFKWARDNGSLVSRVRAIVGDSDPSSESELELESLGRDDVSAFQPGDWVEVTDEPRCLSQKSGSMHRVLKVFPETCRLRLGPSGTPDPEDDDRLFNYANEPGTRGMRVRRWNQRGEVFRVSGGSLTGYFNVDQSTTGLIPVPPEGTTLLLEHGITLSFGTRGGSAGRGFKVGDHWIFAARTEGGTVEKLERALPVGDHHHFARLAVWMNGEVSDCRKHWPPPQSSGHDCACSACVTPESHNTGQFTIQDAVDQLQQGRGGDVCLAPGKYALRGPVRVKGAASLSIGGQGHAHVRCDNEPPFGVGVHLVSQGTAFEVDDCTGVRIENLFIENQTRGVDPIILVRKATGLLLQRLVIDCDANGGGQAFVFEREAHSVQIRQNQVRASYGVVMGTESARVSVSALSIEENCLSCTRTALALQNVALGDRAALALQGVALNAGTRIAGNTIRDAEVVAIEIGGEAHPDAVVEIADNHVQAHASGIRTIQISGLGIVCNCIDGRGPGGARRAPAGISVLPVAAPGAERMRIADNRIEGFDAGVQAVLSKDGQAEASRGLIIERNVITGCSFGLVTSDVSRRAEVSVVDNRIHGLALYPRASDSLAIGIGVFGASSARISGNVVRDIGANAASSSSRLAIAAIGVRSSAINDNEVVGMELSSGQQDVCTGILVVVGMIDLLVCRNHVRRSAAFETASSADNWRGLQIGQESRGIPKPFDDALVIADNVDLADAVHEIVEGATAAIPVRGSVLGNTIHGRSARIAVEVRMPGGQCLFNDNRVDCITDYEGVVTLEAATAIVTSNRVSGAVGTIYLQLPESRPVACTVLGNITVSRIRVRNDVLPAPWCDLNLALA